MKQSPSTDEMQLAFLNSDATYDGIFFTAVKTTGIFCRPSCAARKPLPENVEFFARAEQLYAQTFDNWEDFDPESKPE